MCPNRLLCICLFVAKYERCMVDVCTHATVPSLTAIYHYHPTNGRPLTLRRARPAGATARPTRFHSFHKSFVLGCVVRERCGHSPSIFPVCMRCGVIVVQVHSGSMMMAMSGGRCDTDGCWESLLRDGNNTTRTRSQAGWFRTMLVTDVLYV
ncbi:hypothetical protein OH76DRAFT_591256 [Lentinus brumalis]|uniref:Uncharacterized protein n=1 Tax=Lentinus brumalis TaxID=2498619 RepID=A0A371DU15_9APHY|nr:hypothetical protein OH76DRAFT_591256 [Polyporus brumalis]